MNNLVLNQNSIYTYRKSVNGLSIRVSLQTKNKFEALRVADNVTSLVDLAASNDAHIVRSIIYASINKYMPTFRQERLEKVQSLLGINLTDKGELLSVIIERFIDEKIRLNAWAEKTLLVYKVIYQDLIDLIGDKEIQSISNQDAQIVKKALQRLPSNKNKRAQYRDKTLTQVLKMTVLDEHLMSVRTINTRLGCYLEMFKWCSMNGYAKTNVFEGLLLKDNRNTRNLRLPFSPSDLKVMFRALANSHITKDWQYWLPILALYTGARLNELCQLQYQDILKVNGIWCISITDEGKDQYLKSYASKRLIPLHNNIIELGFLGITKNYNVKTNRIFPELTLRNNRYSHTPSKWFGNLKKKHLENSEKKSFHSFRHTFVDYLFNKLKLQGNPLVKVLLGHTDKEITSGIYGSSFEIEDLNDVIQRINFSEYGLILTK
jgi:integrase|tara:strand:- start:57 stop:1358 length:1302 start_codon:yes stop_codon:yes gene_type:complete